ncbi:hypothetical protein J2Z60_000933 [Lactobacillus colini]|uniref:Acyltransferase 3 domain-containing protein n=1 Tax=Lactobacillus colini TaxID=1819254 RepID=A0ABS4MDN2_9LACO|nr:acyltransferase [Lactobacillus colini]MBP2057761.1 hypothetical protein [Lactobacillus colini]
MTKKSEITDIGDYLKLFACTAVMLQPILSMALKTNPSHLSSIWIGIIFNLVKYTAPAFIFGILYTTIRTTSNMQHYPTYMNNTWHALFIPTIWWTLIYLLFLPWVQQANHYTDISSFMWQFVNGNAAPHMWYNTMMLQFILLMPVFWGIVNLVKHDSHRGLITLMIAILITGVWLAMYDTQIFHGPHQVDWYLCDRIFISFLIYGISGALAWQFNDQLKRNLKKIWLWLLIATIFVFIWINQELFNFGFPIDLNNSPYYKPSMMIYAMLIILLIASLGYFQIDKNIAFTKTVHKFANFAYKAFLSNILWSQVLWLSFTKSLTISNTWLGIIVTYVLTWCLSFSSAFFIHSCWSKGKSLVFKSA